MKKLLSLLMVFAMLLPVCSFAESANMDDFLAAVSQGVKARLDYSEAHPNNENSEERLALVRPELEFVSKYEGVDFGNRKFNELAKSYIAGCRMQESAVTFYDRSYRVYQELWAAGLKARSVTLVEFYEDYGLDLTRDDMDAYYDNLSSNNVQIEFAGIGKVPSDTPTPTSAPMPTPTPTPTSAPTSTPERNTITVSKPKVKLKELLELLGSIARNGLQDYDVTYWTSDNGVYITIVFPQNTTNMKKQIQLDYSGYLSAKASLSELSQVGWDILVEAGFSNSAVYYIEVLDADGVMWLEYMNGLLKHERYK